MIIRNFKPSDLRDVLAIEQNSFPDPYPADILIQLHEKGAGFIVAEVGRRVVGYTIFWIMEDVGHIIAIAVNSNFQNMRVGSTLLQQSLQIIFSNNVNTINLEVRKSNINAINFYIKHGFKKVREEENYYNNGETAFIMQYSHSNN